MKFLDARVALPDYIPMTAWLEHGPFAMWLVERMKPARFVELGTHYGYSYFAVCQAVQEAGLSTQCIAVDTWVGEEHAGFYDESVFQGVVEENRKYAGFSRLLRKTFAEALDDVEDGSVDLLHVDGRHFYEDVKEDFESWIPKLSPSAVVLFHDTEVRERNFGVYRYWAEISAQRPSINFRHCHGLGVLFWGEEVAEGLRDLVQMAENPLENALIVDFFAAAGAGVAAEHKIGERDAQIAQRDAQIAQRDARIAEVSRANEAEAAAFRAQQVDLQARHVDLQASRVELLASQTYMRAQLNDLETRLELQRKREADLLEHHAALNARAGDLQKQLVDAEQRRQASDAAALDANRLRKDLADARNRPFKSLRRKLVSKSLYFLSERDSVFSEKRRAKFLRSARKRDPKRSLSGFAGIPSIPDARKAVAALPQEAAPPEAAVLQAETALSPDAETVMVVSHDASRTGAPILALNLVRELSKSFRVVSVVLGPGELRDAFVEASADLLEIDRRAAPGPLVSDRVAEFARRNNVTKAFVNSVESRSVLPGLRQAEATSVALLHEFACYTRPDTAFPEVFANADQVVFSTNVTLENATSQIGLERPVHVHVLPQGKCEVPARTASDEERAEERAWLDGVLRPGGGDAREFLVIGAGAIEIRKGIDLFIETATRVIDADGGARFRFVWFGDVYGPFNEILRSVNLADQIKRAGIEAQVQIVRATSEIEHAYAAADAMLMSSRLDPLPNVAIDMLLAGKPVLCFDRTTGIADFLRDAGLGAECVARYLDTTEMAIKLRALADDPEHLASVADRGQSRAREIFDFPDYVARLNAIADASEIKPVSIENDLEYLVGSGAFRPDFCPAKVGRTSSEEDSIRAYLHANRHGPFFRKPVPGFNQMVYAGENGWGGTEDPFVQYLKAGRPDGRWSIPVIDEQHEIKPDLLRGARVALHVHAYFVDELRDILGRLKLNTVQPTLFVTARDQDLDMVRGILDSHDGPVADVQGVQNRGRDIAPLLTAVGPRLVEEFDIIGHLHTKRSMHVEDRKIVANWIEFLMENSVGGPRGGPMLDRIITAMQDDPEIGIVYPDDPGIVGWTKNMRHAEDIAARMGLHDLPDRIDFPMGTMFWMRADILRRFVDLDLGWDDYPAEPLPIDGTMLHAIERLFGVVPGMVGQKSAVTNVHGITR